MKSFPNQLAATLSVVALTAALAGPSQAQSALGGPALVERNVGEGVRIATASAAAQNDAVKTPVAEWNFAEGTGDSVADASGHNNNGTMTGGATWTTGVVGQHALHLIGQTGDNKGAFLDVPRAAIDTSRSFTVSCWAKFHNLKKGYQTLVSIDGSQVSGFFLQVRGDTNLLALSILPTDDTASNTPFVAASTAPPDTNVWYHVVGVYDASAQTIALYLNGVPQSTTNFTTPWKAEGHTAIGRGMFGGKPVDFADADIDDVRFYNAALSTPEVAALTHSGLPTPTLRIDAAQPSGKVSPTLYGMMTEEINHAFDGGLYAELIQNRDFKADTTKPAGWSLLQDGGAMGSMALDTSQPVNEAVTSSLRVTVDSASGDGARVGVANAGYWGIPIKPATKYRVSFWAKAAQGFKGDLNVALESSDGHMVYAKASAGRPGGDWKRYEVVLKTDDAAMPTSNARFVIGADSPGTFNLAMVSLFPPTYNDRPNGARADLMQKMAALKPTFLRMPGGNYLEGDSIPNRFDWKKTIGPVETRPGHQGPWGYHSTDGFGLLEMAEWCEDLHMQPILAVYSGYSLHGDHVAAGPALSPYVDDAMDEIEYLTGDKTTKWGAQRVKDGHPNPFALQYVEIGNEDNTDRSGSYDGRFTQYYDAIKARYPQLQLIATTDVKSRTPDILDQHFYRAIPDMEQHVHQYDGYSRSGPKIMVGEWASEQWGDPWNHPTEGQPTPNWQAAVADAAWLTGLEQNSDVVVMEAYAPLLVNINSGGRQWPQNLIGYNAQDSYGSPSYYVQSLFASHVGDSLLHTTMTGALDLFWSATEDATTGVVYVKMVNVADHAQAVKIDVHGSAAIRASQDAATYTMTSAHPTDTNSIDAPESIVPLANKSVGAGTAFTYTFPASSVTVLVLGGK